MTQAQEKKHANGQMDDFGNSLYDMWFTLPVDSYVATLHAAVRFLLEDQTETGCTEENLKHFGFIA